MREGGRVAVRECGDREEKKQKQAAEMKAMTEEEKCGDEEHERKPRVKLSPYSEGMCRKHQVRSTDNDINGEFIHEVCLEK